MIYNFSKQREGCAKKIPDLEDLLKTSEYKVYYNPKSLFIVV